MNTDIDEAYPRLETARLILRALRMEDADFIFKKWGNPIVTYYMRDEELLKTREQTEEMLRPLQKRCLTLSGGGLESRQKAA